MPNYIINLSDAESWGRSWQTTPPKDLAKAHQIPLEVLNGLIETPDMASVRAYMGVDSGGIQRLMIVAVDSNGNDLIDNNNNQFIYSGTSPCPENCDTSSPLYNP